MDMIKEVLKGVRGHERADIMTYHDWDKKSPNVYAFDALMKAKPKGLPISSKRIDGKLYYLFSEEKGHTMVIGASGSGKTTGWISPCLSALIQNCSGNNKCSFLISDPKGELFTMYEKPLRDAGFKIRLLNFKDSAHSDCQNILMKIYDKWQEYVNAPELRKAEKKADADQEIQNFIDNFFSGTSKDPIWDISAMNMFKCFLLGMLEDSVPKDEQVTKDGVAETRRIPPSITRDNFNLKTVISIFNSFSFESSRPKDKGYFTGRPQTSEARKLASGTFLDIAESTWKSVVFMFAGHMKRFSTSAMQNITLCNTFGYTDLAEEKTALFIRYSDSKKENYDMVEYFIRDIYSTLIDYADERGGQLKFPVYMLLDEFGNLPPSQNFGNIISACRSRNIWFTLVIQSYSQLYGKYGNDLADTIKDNCNLKCFFGTNDYNTLNAFSRECLRTTQVALSSVFKSKSANLDVVDLEEVPVVTVSELNAVEEGEFYIKRFRKNAMKSMTVRNYLCPEFMLGKTKASSYKCEINADDPKYRYSLPVKQGSDKPYSPF